MNLSVLPRIQALLREKGPVDTGVIARMLGRPSNQITHLLQYHARRGTLKRLREAGTGRYAVQSLWSLP